MKKIINYKLLSANERTKAKAPLTVWYLANIKVNKANTVTGLGCRMCIVHYRNPGLVVENMATRNGMKRSLTLKANYR